MIEEADDWKQNIPKGFLVLPKEVISKIFFDSLFYGSLSVPSSEFVSDIIKHPHDEEGNGISVYVHIAMCLINLYSTEDPSKLHYSVSREVLNESGGRGLEMDEKARDMLARELVKECRVFASQLIPLGRLQENVEQKELSFVPRPDKSSEHLAHAINGSLWIDHLFIQHLEKIGASGKELAMTIAAASKDWMDDFCTDKKALKLFRLWVDPEMQPYNCRYLKALAKVVWKDRIQARFARARKFQPAIPSGMLTTTIKPAISKGSRFEKDENQIRVFDAVGKFAISVKTPCLEKRTLDLVMKGIGSLGSLSGHRVLRWEVKTGCQNIINGDADPRVIVTEGGYEGIANLIGCGKSTATISEVKSILYAQANANFTMPNGDRTSSLISLHEIERHRNREPNKINIVLGDWLLPHFLFTLPRNEQRLLVPITDLPPLIGSPNTFAAQAMLQILVLEEFSKQSDRMAQKGSIHIPPEKWEKMAKEAGLPKARIPEIISGWASNSINGTAFLQRDGEEYTLSSAHTDVVHFLEEQGKARVNGSQRGAESAQRAAQKKAKILQTS